MSTNGIQPWPERLWRLLSSVILVNTRLSVDDLFLEIAKGNVPNHSSVHKFGHNVSITSSRATLWSLGTSEYVYIGDIDSPDAAATVLKVSSSSANDAGTLVSSGTATGGSLTTLIDSGATFISDGVVPRDVVLNDTGQTHGFITSVDSETQVTVWQMDNGANLNRFNSIGDSYRIASSANTGAIAVKIQGQDASNVQFTEYVILNGQTEVNTIGIFWRIYRMQVIGAGTAKENVGILYAGTGIVTTGVPANIYSAIDVGYNQTQMALYTIPAGKTAFVTHPYISLGEGTGGAKDIDAEMVVRNPGGVFRVNHELHAKSGGSAYIHPHWLPHKVSQGSDIEIRAEVSSGTVEVAGGFEIILVDN